MQTVHPSLARVSLDITHPAWATRVTQLRGSVHATEQNRTETATERHRESPRPCGQLTDSVFLGIGTLNVTVEETQQTTSKELPNCQIPAAVNPAGFLRFEVSQSQAETVHKQLTGDLEQVPKQPSPDTHVTVDFILTHDAQQSVSAGAEQLQDRFPQAGAVSIPLAGDPVYTLTILLNRRQISEMIDSDPNPVHYDDHDTVAASETETVDTDELPVSEWFIQQFRLTPNAGLVTARQIESALNGATNPPDSIDFDTLRESGFEMS